MQYERVLDQRHPGDIRLRYQGRPTAAAREQETGGSSDLVCRMLNVLVAVAALTLLFPLMLVIAALVKATSKGPVLYTQTRVGLDRRGRGRTGTGKRRHNLGGRPFTIYKFRTMSVDHSGNGDEVWARPDDPRVTPLGRILRTYRLDELPQLGNVLFGDMNIVGPRPEQPTIFARLRERIHRYHERQRIRPGITGWAQINHRYDADEEDVKRKLAFDLDYIARRSAAHDLRIMLLTVPVIVFRRGAW